jgi:glycosyltransferase involved in cell wall biosynthesis
MHNREDTIEACLNSVLRQDYGNIEILIVDDCSTDNSTETVKKIYDSRIKVFSYDKKIGAQGARNVAIKNALGDWIVFLDSDDLLTNNSISVRYSVVNDDPDVDFIYGDVLAADNTVVEFKNINNMSRCEIKKHLFKELCLCCFSSMMVRKKSIEQIGCLDENYLAWQDDSLVLSMFMHGAKFRHCGEIVCKMRPSNNQISSNFNYKYQGIKKIVECYQKEIIEANGQMVFFLWEMRIFLDYLRAKPRTMINRALCKMLSRFLLLYFEHIWG